MHLKVICANKIVFVYHKETIFDLNFRYITHVNILNELLSDGKDAEPNLC